VWIYASAWILDITSFAQHRSVDRILSFSSDQDMIPAMKEARKSGLEVGIIQLGTNMLHDQLAEHADFVRGVKPL